jgi:DNA-binding CsgD family transcriptional regulator/tetratricopeptide (TPR) repeat protein
MTALVGRCSEADGAQPFLPLVEALAPIVDELGAEGLKQRFGNDALLVARMFYHATDQWDLARQAPTELDRTILFHAIGTLLRNAADPAGAVLVLEDIHWADQSSSSLIEYLSHQLPGSRLLLVATYRDVEVDRDGPVWSTLRRLYGERNVERVTLAGLSEPDVSKMARAIIGAELPQPFTHSLYQQTDGNPFFVEEILRHLMQEGVLTDDAPGDRASLLRMRLPDGVRDVIDRRLARLRDDCRSLLERAAVLGQTFRHDLLAAYAERTEDELLDQMEEALAARLVVELPGYEVTYSFQHALIRAALLEGVSRARAARLHRHAGEAIERVHEARLDAWLAELAYHFAEAGASGDLPAAKKALSYGLQAAEQSMSKTAYAETAGLYESALRALETCDAANRKQRCEILVALGDARTRAGDATEARPAYETAMALARELRDGELFGRAAVGFSGPWNIVAAADDAVIRVLEEANNKLRPRDRGLQSKMLARLARELYSAGEDDRTQTLSKAAVAAARRSGDASALSYALAMRNLALWEPARFDERLAVVAELERLAVETEDREIRAAAHITRIPRALEMGDMARVDVEIEAYERIATELRQPLMTWQALVRRAMRVLFEGRFQEAEELATEALGMGETAQEPAALQVFGAQMFMLRWQQGRLAEIEPVLRVQAQAAPTVAAWRSALAVAYCELGREAEARTELRALAEDGFAALFSDQARPIGAVGVAEVCAFLNDGEYAPPVYRHLSAYRGRNVVLGEGVACLGSADEYLGLLAEAYGKREEAATHFEAAIEMNSCTGGRSWLANTQYEYGRLLIARHGPGDRKRAFELLTEALGTARELGMATLEDRVGTVLSAHPGLTPAFPDRLTIREVDILRLIAAGRSNREISDELVLSVRTVARHITNIYSKIGARGKADATAYAFRHNLTPK